ncbi:ABC transporter ATP-binding protein [Candidatus Acetothermia bacterium]|nr:ABC transporter ATP-binding protein [Candidatus Acetothermia bacterium]
MEAIRCEGLTKHYGSIAALDDLNLSVAKGSIFGFLGPNGAGKTTTVKLLTGLITPTEGRAWVADEEIESSSISLRRKIGYLPEEPSFYNWMSGREFLSFVGELHHLSSREIRVRCDELLKMVDLQGDAERRIGGYSRGMRQRLGIAQSLINRPEVLFLDEPCSALDPVGRREVLSIIQRLRRETTVFMSSHILSDVERVCDVVGIISRGRLVTESPIEELRERYARSVFELQFEEEASHLISQLEALPWVAKVEMVRLNGEPIIRLQARDVNHANLELPRIVASSGLTLLRYELTLPSLEDIFIELVGNGGER